MNKVVLMGRLTRDPELRFTAVSGTAVSRFAVAVDRKKKDDGADFINCVAFGKTAETISQYLVKGRQILIEGNIRTGSYENDEGKKIYTTNVNVERFEFIGNKADSGTSNNDDSFGAGIPNDVVPEDDGEMPF